MSEVRIKMLGKFDILVGDKSFLYCIGNSPKSILLLKALILSKGKPVYASKLIDHLWIDTEKSKNPGSALKTMVSRIRSSLAKAHPVFKDCIISENRSYLWNPGGSCSVDVFDFELLCDEVSKANQLDAVTKEKYTRILDIYEGDLSYTYNENEWISGRSLYLHLLYMQTVYGFLDMLKNAGDNEQIIQVSRIALDIDPFDDRLNLELIAALKESGHNRTAMSQYMHITGAYQRYFDVEPSEEILGVYYDLLKEDFDPESHFNAIRKTLMNGANTNLNAFVCNYFVFNEIYQILLRSMDRHGNNIFLALLTVSQTSGDSSDPIFLDSVMQNLLDILQLCLRKGDTISRYSPSEYAILLPMRDFTNGSLIIERIKKLFYKIHTDASIMLSFQFGNLDQKEEQKKLSVDE